MKITVEKGREGKFFPTNRDIREFICDNLIPMITGETVSKLFREGAGKETKFEYKGKEGSARIDLQSHNSGAYNIQIQASRKSLAGVLIDERLASTDPKDPVNPKTLAGSVRSALEASLKDGVHFWEVKKDA